jgi:hypothetical protein
MYNRVVPRGSNREGSGWAVRIAVLLACCGVARPQTIQAVHFQKAPVPPCKTILLVRQRPDLEGFRSVTTGEALSTLREWMVRFQEELASSLRAAGFDAKIDPVPGEECDLHIVLRFVRGQVNVRQPKGLHGLFYYEPTKLWLDLAYVRPPREEIGRLRAKFASLSDPAAKPKSLAGDVTAFTVARIGVRK